VSMLIILFRRKKMIKQAEDELGKAQQNWKRADVKIIIELAAS